MRMDQKPQSSFKLAAWNIHGYRPTTPEVEKLFSAESTSLAFLSKIFQGKEEIGEVKPL